MTDHYIQRRLPSGDLRTPRREAENFEHGDYRGEVELYYPPKCRQTPENALYLALAQVQQGSNIDGGIVRLQATIEEYKPERPEFYYELARAYSKKSDYEADIHWCNEALRHDANFVPALKELAAAATSSGKAFAGPDSARKGPHAGTADSVAFSDLGNVYLLQDRAYEPRRCWSGHSRWIRYPSSEQHMGLAALKKNDTASAEKYFRAASASSPILQSAKQFGQFLAGRQAYAKLAITSSGQYAAILIMLKLTIVTA